MVSIDSIMVSIYNLPSSSVRGSLPQTRERNGNGTKGTEPGTGTIYRPRPKMGTEQERERNKEGTELEVGQSFLPVTSLFPETVSSSALAYFREKIQEIL